MSDFYQLWLSSDPGWLLKVPDVQPLRPIVWRLLRGQRLDVPDGTVIPVVMSKAGEPLAFSLTAVGIPVVRSDVARELEKVAPGEVQFIAASIEGIDESYEILNVTTLRDCIDEWASSFSDYRGPGDFHAVNKLVIDPVRAAGGHVFRVLHWPVPLIISAVVREMLIRRKVRGVGYFPVC